MKPTKKKKRKRNILIDDIGFPVKYLKSEGYKVPSFRAKIKKEDCLNNIATLFAITAIFYAKRAENRRGKFMAFPAYLYLRPSAFSVFIYKKRLLELLISL
jgi:hypothetical protein